VRRAVGAILASAAILGLMAPAPAAAHPSLSPSSPRFEPGRCEWQTPEGETEGTDYTCGYLWVPMLQSAPSAREIGLAVMILHASGPTPAPDPIIWNSGGPGGSAIDDYGAFLATHSLRHDRDIILVDQRGSGHSIPALVCPDLDQLQYASYFDDAYYQRIGEALVACADDHAARGLDFSAFTAVESASDIEDLRLALDYEKVNLYGISYGTLISLETLRRYPAGLRSVVLDGVFSLGTDPNVVDQDLALERVFSACFAQPECLSEFPDLYMDYFDAIARLNADPTLLAEADQANGIDEDFLLTGDMLRNALYLLLYYEGMVPFIPFVVHAAGEGNLGPLRSLLDLGDSDDDDLTSGAYWAAYCHYAHSAGSTADQAVACADYLEATGQPVPGGFPGASTESGPAPTTPVSSDVPALIINGEFDPITPPSYGEAVARTLSHSTVLLVPGAAHGAFGMYDCIDVVISRFFDAPQAAMDLTCLADFPPLEFKGPLEFAEVVDLFPERGTLLGARIVQLLVGVNAVGWQYAAGVFLYFGALWIFLVIVVGVSLLSVVVGWLSTLRRKSLSVRPPVLVQLVPLWSLLATTALTGLLAYFALFGWRALKLPELQSLQLWVRPLPLFIGISLLLSLAGTCRGLRTAAWPRWQRVLQLGITTSAFFITLGMVILGVIAAWI
jgi:pimeloyl-ACP methyl ester carboxylesterase